MSDDTQTPLKLDAFWPYQTVVLADLVSRNTHGVLKAHSDLNLSQWRVLAAIAEAPGRTAAEVTAVTPMDKGIVSRAVASLIEGHLIARTPDPDDKRRAALHLTPQGQSDYNRVARHLTENLSRALPRDMNAEEFSRALGAFIKGMRDL